MNAALLLLKATVLLSIASCVYMAARKASAASRHLLCVFTLALICIAPFCNVSVPIRSDFIFRAAAQAGSTALAGNTTTAVSCLTIIWLIGALLVLARFLLGVAYLTIKSRSARNDDGLPPGIHVRLAKVATPVVWGWINPVILLPSSAVAWTNEQRDMAIQHELTHLLRHDNWTSLLVAAARAAYWFHPLVWWLSARLLIEQELVCDERVLASGASATGYAELLVDVSRNLSSPALFGCAMFSNANQLRGRIMKILAYRNENTSSKTSRFGFALVLALLVSTALMAPVNARNAAITDKPEHGGVYRIGGDVLAPKVLDKIEPQYTKEAKKKKIQGVTILSLIIDGDGQPQNIHVIKSLNAGLDQKAIEAVRQWTFEPASKNGQPVAVEATIEVNFRLK